MIDPPSLRRPHRARPAAFVATAALALAAPLAAAAQLPATVFRQSCASCHTIGGGRLVGPDLKDVAARKDEAWLLAFVTNPAAVLGAGDPYALKLKEEAQGAVMPPIAGMTRETAKALLELIAAESKLPKSQFVGLQITDEPFTAAHLDRGRALFTGAVKLQNGGAACLSCHTVRGVGGLSGGRLGPDLTKVYERMQGRKNLASWLLGPATPTMQPLFAGTPLTNEEILALVAYLEERARGGGEDDRSAQLSFLLLGLAGAVAGLVVADGAWRRRFRAVRRPLVSARRTLLSRQSERHQGGGTVAHREGGRGEG
jgi:mono/diheme cytochrome c family protein